MFQPNRDPGLHLPDNFQPTSEVDFFRLFFTTALVGALVNFTNIYAATHILTHSSYADSDGSWRDTTAAEIESLLALFIYFGLVRVSNVEQYWSCKTLYQGLWARRMMSRNRFKALLAFFHVVDPGQEVEGDRLRKVRYTYEAIRQKCRELYQPSQNVSVDERMIRFKGRHIMKVYIKNKPTKWGFKSFALCDSSNHYHWNFELYTGQGPAASEYGKTYDLVLRLLQPLLDQGYHLYTDNYYTSNDLATSLLARQTHLVGTVRANRTGFPVALKNVKHFERTAVRGELRYVRNGPLFTSNGLTRGSSLSFPLCILLPTLSRWKEK